jgi:hypothetical protein
MERIEEEIKCQQLYEAARDSRNRKETQKKTEAVHSQKLPHYRSRYTKRDSGNYLIAEGSPPYRTDLFDTWRDQL